MRAPTAASCLILRPVATDAAGPTSKDPSTALASTNLAIKFLLELCALALLAYWGAVTGDGAWAVVLGIAAPAAMIAVWGRFAAPRSAHRLPPPFRIPLELALFALACAAGFAAGAKILSITFALVALGNALAMTRLRQWVN